MSDMGEVRSLDRFFDNNGGQQFSKGRLLKQIVHTQGYLQVTLALQGDKKVCLVHELILTAFIGIRPVGQVGRHRDNNKKNNSLENLQWGTQSDNLYDRIGHGTAPRGERHWNAKLIESQVIEIRLAKGSFSAKFLAEKYKLNIQTIYKIWKNICWRGELK